MNQSAMQKKSSGIKMSKKSLSENRGAADAKNLQVQAQWKKEKQAESARRKKSQKTKRRDRLRKNHRRKFREIQKKPVRNQQFRKMKRKQEQKSKAKSRMQKPKKLQNSVIKTERMAKSAKNHQIKANACGKQAEESSEC